LQKPSGRGRTKNKGQATGLTSDSFCCLSRCWFRWLAGSLAGHQRVISHSVSKRPLNRASLRPSEAAEEATATPTPTWMMTLVPWIFVQGWRLGLTSFYQRSGQVGLTKASDAVGMRIISQLIFHITKPHPLTPKRHPVSSHHPRQSQLTQIYLQ